MTNWKSYPIVVRTVRLTGPKIPLPHRICPRHRPPARRNIRPRIHRRRQTRIPRLLPDADGDNGGKALVHSGSVLIADNILWSGKVVQPVAHGDRHTQALIEFNRMVAEDPRVENVIVALRDGLNLIG